ncbi:hypothetical protein FS842_003964 [Serendipita sp. 407]|nr:hypothetical protein FS842_003964 [Serendipita sp. 407]
MVKASEVSFNKKIFQIVCAVFFCLTTTGVIFGYAALKPVLVRHEVYRELCTEEEKRSGVWVCEKQDLRLNFMFTLSAVITNTIALPVGMLLDRAGPRAATLLGAFFFFCGNAVFGIGIENEHIDTYYVGFVLLALGGPLIFLSSFHLSNAFPRNSGLILSFISGSFDASSVPYLLYNEALPNVPIRTFFWSYTIIPILLVIQCITISPSSSYEREALKNRDADEEEGDLTSPGTAVGQDHSDRILGVMFGKTAWQQIRSSWWILITIFLCVYMTRINFFIQTVASQMLWYLQEHDDAIRLATTFTILLPLGGAIGITPVGVLLDRGGILAASIVVLFMGLFFGLFGIMRSYAGQLVAIGILVFLRPLMYTFVGDYCAKVFGFGTFGTVYGLANTLSGLFGLVLRPIDLLLKSKLHGDYTPPNLVLLGCGIVASSLLTWRVWVGTRPVRLQ